MNGGFTGDVNLNVNTKFDLKDQGENVKYGRNPTREFRTVCLSLGILYIPLPARGILCCCRSPIVPLTAKGDYPAHRSDRGDTPYTTPLSIRVDLF